MAGKLPPRRLRRPRERTGRLRQISPPWCRVRSGGTTLCDPDRREAEFHGEIVRKPLRRAVTGLTTPYEVQRLAPNPGELVVGDVDEIADFGVFVDLDE